jgi:hypothetical protein
MAIKSDWFHLVGSVIGILILGQRLSQGGPRTAALASAIFMAHVRNFQAQCATGTSGYQAQLLPRKEESSVLAGAAY